MVGELTTAVAGASTDGAAADAAAAAAATAAAPPPAAAAAAAVAAITAARARAHGRRARRKTRHTPVARRERIARAARETRDRAPPNRAATSFTTSLAALINYSNINNIKHNNFTLPRAGFVLATDPAPGGRIAPRRPVRRTGFVSEPRHRCPWHCTGYKKKSRGSAT